MNYSRFPNKVVSILLVALIMAVIFGSIINVSNACVDLNTASSEELITLPGIGASKAADLIAYRPYQTWDDVDAVPGIGPATIEDIKPFCCPLGDNPLPVVFQGLSARKTKDGIEISFSAISENIVGFFIYRAKSARPINPNVIKAKEGQANYRFTVEAGKVTDVFTVGAVELNGLIVRSSPFNPTSPLAVKAITWARIKNQQ